MNLIMWASLWTFLHQAMGLGPHSDWRAETPIMVVGSHIDPLGYMLVFKWKWVNIIVLVVEDGGASGSSFALAGYIEGRFNRTGRNDTCPPFDGTGGLWRDYCKDKCFEDEYVLVHPPEQLKSLAERWLSARERVVVLFRVRRDRTRSAIEPIYEYQTQWS